MNISMRLFARVGTLLVVLLLASVLAACGGDDNGNPSAHPLSVMWMQGYAAADTPAQYNRVGVIKVGPSSAENVLILEPGTSAGGAYFVPLAQWLVSKLDGWQVWSVERRENQLEDQSELNLYKEGKATDQQLFDYYLGYLKDQSVKKHFQSIPDSSVKFAKKWGMKVAVRDLHQVIAAAEELGGRIVLGGHSLGGSVVTAYATWDFDGRAGADDLAGLVYIDGGSRLSAISSQEATQKLQALMDTSSSPWLSFGGIPAPFAGIFNATGSAAALFDPNNPSLGQKSGLLPPNIVPSVPVTNVGQYGYSLNVKSSPPSLVAAQAHLGTGISSKMTNGAYGWDSRGALTPIKRYARMFSGGHIPGVDGTEWYFPQRLTLDTSVVDNGNRNPAQKVLDVHATMGQSLPHDLLIYAFGAHLGGAGVTQAAKQLARQSDIPMSNLTLENYQNKYAHNDPAGAYPDNAFFDQLVKFLQKVSAQE